MNLLNPCYLLIIVVVLRYLLFSWWCFVHFQQKTIGLLVSLTLLVLFGFL